MRKKIKIKTNRGFIFDFFLNSYINFILWLNHIDDNKEMAVNTAAKIINSITQFEEKIVKLFK